jgi:hypothetical protein
MVTDGFFEWSPWGPDAGAPFTMVGGWDCCCMGLPLTDVEVDFPCCDGPPTVTGAAAVESVADFLVAFA